jgi:glycerol-3-phosphate dehydrogenase
MFRLGSSRTVVKPMRNGPGAAWRDFDVAVVGGGINGCGIAREAAGRDSLSEREALWRMAPHIIRPLRTNTTAAACSRTPIAA